jgi:hypothetical protein
VTLVDVPDDVYVNESNTINATIKNNGGSDITWSFNTTLSVNLVGEDGSVVDYETVSSLNAGAIITGAGTNKWAYEGDVSTNPPSTANDPSGATVTYTNIEADDGTYELYETAATGKYAAHRFNISVNESEPAKINVTWNGKGYHDTLDDGAYLYIWNGTAYEELANNSGDGDEVTLTEEKVSSASDYISASGDVTVLVVQKSTQVRVQGKLKRSHIETDYVKVIITL